MICIYIYICMYIYIYVHDVIYEHMCICIYIYIYDMFIVANMIQYHVMYISVMFLLPSGCRGDRSPSQTLGGVGSLRVCGDPKIEKAHHVLVKQT